MQILLHVKRGVAAGSIKDGHELPSRRVLSSLLGVNPNTVQKAYGILEDERLVLSRPGAKSCMFLDNEKIKRLRKELLEADAKTMVSAMQQMGVTKEQAIELVERYWE